MGEEDLVSFIQRSREKRRTDEQIKSTLLSVGWKKERVESAFRKAAEIEAMRKRGELEPSPQKPPARGAQLPQQPSAAVQFPSSPQGAAQPVAIPPQAAQMLTYPQQQQTGQTPQSQQAAQPPQQQTPAPVAKKAGFSFQGIFGKKQQVPAQQGAFQAPSSAQQGAVQAGPPASPPPSYALQQILPPPIPKIPPIPGAQPAAIQPAAAQSPLQQIVAAPAQQPQGKPANQAFANLGVAPQPAAKMNKLFPIIAAAILLLALVAGYYFVVMKGGASTVQPGIPAIPNAPAKPANNQTLAKLPGNQSAALPNQTANGSSPPNASNATIPNAGAENKTITPKPPSLPKNATQNQTAPQQPKNQTAPPAQSAPKNQSNATSANKTAAPPPASPQYARMMPYESSGPYQPDKFCRENGGTFIRAHFRGYYGSQCTNDRNIEGFVNLTAFKSLCELIPCCIDEPPFEFSTKYDYFECGFAASSQ